MIITATAGTHEGCVRKNNEDNFYINGFYKKDTDTNSCIYSDDNPRDSYTYAVFDGVGGAAFGELAALYAAEELYEYDDRQLDEQFSDYIETVNSRICGSISENGGMRMGSTAALVFIKDRDASVCNIGDSRVYLFRKGELTQLSHDHTKRQSMFDFGLIGNDQEKAAARGHILTQYLGVFPEEFRLDPHIERRQLETGDYLLLCSDGLTDMVSDEAIRDILSRGDSAETEELAEELIREAVGNGGRDNITVVVVKAI